MSAPHGPTPTVLTIGEALIALAAGPGERLRDAAGLQLHAGGAELNFAVGLARLGQAVSWLGAVGDDEMGRRVLAELDAEGVGAEHVRVVAGGRTAVYLREALATGPRRLAYYRSGSVGELLGPDLWPARASSWAWLHVTGITAALSPTAHALIAHAVDQARARDIPVSFDPNFRPALWSEADAAPVLRDLARRADTTLLSDADARVMVGTDDPSDALLRLADLGLRRVVLKRGGAAVHALDGGRRLTLPVAATTRAIDTVGAGDGFDAGFVAATLAGADMASAIGVGCFVGARAVEAVGDHRYPKLADLPADLAEIFRAAA